MTVATDPISAIATAVSDLSKLIGQMSAQTHPIIYMWRINRLTNHLTKECKKDPNINPVDLVGACTHDLDSAEQTFILHVVQQKLGLIK